MKATKNRPELCTEASHDDLLHHYLRGAQQTVQSVDQLGNFLMGFGVLALGYLLNSDLSAATAVFGSASQAHAATARPESAGCVARPSRSEDRVSPRALPALP